jgi:vanillate O-demethylase monooxygenase subunit
MAEFDHWHPVLDARRLGEKPVAVQLHGQELVLFRGRGPEGQPAIGAFDDRCVHRRMRLSCGSVVDGRLQCCYHGWTFDTTGAGESPGTPKLRAQAAAYDTCEHLGTIWLKRAGSDAPFPTFDHLAGYQFVRPLWHIAQAPLEVVLDNFTEVEHTPTTHALLGYELASMSEVETRVEPTDSTVRVFNAGPQKRISPLVQTMFGIRAGDRFVDDWTTHFSPVYSVYDQYWSDARTGLERPVRWRIWVFFNPLDDERTQLVTLPFVRSRLPWPLNSVKIFGSLMTWFVNREIELDMRMLSQLADKSPAIEGMKLSRFDRVLGLQRDRIERIYRQRDAQCTPANGHTSAATIPQNADLPGPLAG